MNRRQEWERAFDESKIRDADFDTMSGLPVDPVYGPDDGEFPGQYPYTRGPYASMYRSKLWTMRMFAGFGTAVDTNQRFHDILGAGARRGVCGGQPQLRIERSGRERALGEIGPRISDCK